MINWIRDYFAIPKETYEWYKQDLLIMLGASAVFLLCAGMAAYQTEVYKRLAQTQNARGEIITAFIFGCFSLYSFITYIRLCIKNKGIMRT
jgi:hypothetical protein